MKCEKENAIYDRIKNIKDKSNKRCERPVHWKLHKYC